MSLLTNKRFRHKLNISKYDILNTGFVEVLKFFELCDKENISEKAKIDGLLKIFYGKDSKIFNKKTGKIEIVTSIEHIDLKDISVYVNNVYEHIHSVDDNYNEESKPKSSIVKQYDFEKDYQYIVGAFMQIYKINLYRENLHWVEFMSLFKSLPDGTVLSNIIEIRNKKIPTAKEGYSPDDILSIKRSKEYYSLNLEEVEQHELDMMIKREEMNTKLEAIREKHRIAKIEYNRLENERKAKEVELEEQVVIEDVQVKDGNILLV